MYMLQPGYPQHESHRTNCPSSIRKCQASASSASTLRVAPPPPKARFIVGHLTLDLTLTGITVSDLLCNCRLSSDWSSGTRTCHLFVASPCSHERHSLKLHRGWRFFCGTNISWDWMWFQKSKFSGGFSVDLFSGLRDYFFLLGWHHLAREEVSCRNKTGAPFPDIFKVVIWFNDMVFVAGYFEEIARQKASKLKLKETFVYWSAFHHMVPLPGMLIQTERQVTGTKCAGF